MSPLLLQFIVFCHIHCSQVTEKSVGVEREDVLAQIDSLATESGVCDGKSHVTLPLQLNTHRFATSTAMTDTMANILTVMAPPRDQSVVEAVLRAVLSESPLLSGVHLLELTDPGHSAAGYKLPQLSEEAVSRVIQLYTADGKNFSPAISANQLSNQTWWRQMREFQGQLTSDLHSSGVGRWSLPYFDCHTSQWLLTYSVNLTQTAAATHPNTSLVGLISLVFDLTSLDIDQCGDLRSNNSWQSTDLPNTLTELRGTHKCHSSTTQCVAERGRGWTVGSYRCVCRVGFFSPAPADHSSGQQVPVLPVQCRACSPGCHSCRTGRPCLATYHWPVRVCILSISMICVGASFVLTGFIVHYRRLKVIKSGSPVFLVLTLLGCAIMYSEMAAIYPVLDMVSCVATKWTRHLGFCITYSALLLKTWRVSLTYRVKSAHKLKLTDRQLIQWLFPIFLIMAVYLACWTVSDPPRAVAVADGEGLLYMQCHFGWWDHCLAAGEVVFLCWGIRVCLSVRNAPSLFDEARYIRWSIYNIAVTNASMAVVHLFVTSGPDVKYVLGFLRTQLSTTTTLLLVFLPKLRRIAQGLGDEYDKSCHHKAATAYIDTDAVENDYVDIYQENEELKEEIQKLAAQVEFVKIVSMHVDNRHAKPRRDGCFSDMARRKSSIGTLLRLGDSAPPL